MLIHLCLCIWELLYPTLAFQSETAAATKMVVIVYVIAHEGSLITRDTISNNISNPPFEPIRICHFDQSWSSQADSFLKPNSPFNPLSSVYLMPLCDPRLKLCSGKKLLFELFMGQQLSVKVCQIVNFSSISSKQRKQQDSKWIWIKGVDKDWELERIQKPIIRSILRHCPKEPLTVLHICFEKHTRNRNTTTDHLNNVHLDIVYVLKTIL